MTHLQIIESYPAYAAGTQAAQDREQVDAHLTACASCRSAFALLHRTLEPGPAPQRLTADPFLPTRIRALAERPSEPKRISPVLRWSFASAAVGAAIVLGVLLGSHLPNRERATPATSSDFVSEFATSIAVSDLGDRWYSAIESEGGIQR